MIVMNKMFSFASFESINEPQIPVSNSEEEYFVFRPTPLSTLQNVKSLSILNLDQETREKLLIPKEQIQDVNIYQFLYSSKFVPLNSSIWNDEILINILILRNLKVGHFASEGYELYNKLLNLLNRLEKGNVNPQMGYWFEKIKSIPHLFTFHALNLSVWKIAFFKYLNPSQTKIHKAIDFPTSFRFRFVGARYQSDLYQPEHQIFYQSHMNEFVFSTDYESFNQLVKDLNQNLVHFRVEVEKLVLLMDVAKFQFQSFLLKNKSATDLLPLLNDFKNKTFRRPVKMMVLIVQEQSISFENQTKWKDFIDTLSYNHLTDKIAFQIENSISLNTMIHIIQHASSKFETLFISLSNVINNEKRKFSFEMISYKLHPIQSIILTNIPFTKENLIFLTIPHVKEFHFVRSFGTECGDQSLLPFSQIHNQVKMELNSWLGDSWKNWNFLPDSEYADRFQLVRK